MQSQHFLEDQRHNVAPLHMVQKTRGLQRTGDKEAGAQLRHAVREESRCLAAASGSPMSSGYKHTNYSSCLACLYIKDVSF